MIKQIGRMRDRVIIQAKQRIDVPGGGGLSSYVTVLNDWCESEPISSQRVFQSDQHALKNGFVLSVRFRNDFIPVADMRVLYKGKVYTINGETNIQERDRFYDITIYTNSYPVS